MKKLRRIIFILILIAAGTTTTAFAQQVSSRAKAMRMMSFAKPEYMVKDIKVFTDTMTVYTLAEYVIYPFGKWNSIEQYVTEGQIKWERKVGYQHYLDSMHVSVNTLERLDGSYINVYRSITTGIMEMLSAKITDPEVIFENGLHAGMSKDDVFAVFFKKYPKSYTSDICVLKVISGADEVGQIYTFQGNKLRHIQVVSKYKYY